MDNFKKDFQKAVKAFRDTQPKKREYPKAMMTASQIRKGTATINCSYGTGAKELAEKMMNFPQFKEWCEEWGIKKVYIETVPNPYGEVMQIQIRIIFPTEEEIKKLNEEIAAEELHEIMKDIRIENGETVITIEQAMKWYPWYLIVRAMEAHEADDKTISYVTKIMNEPENRNIPNWEEKFLTLFLMNADHDLIIE